MTRLRCLTTNKPQRGFSLVSALFLVVVLATLGAYMATISTVQQYTPAFGVQGARAYQAARAGIEWGINRAQDAAGVAGACGAAPSTLTTNNFTLTGGTLNGFAVTVTCSYVASAEGGLCRRIFTIDSTGRQGTFGEVGYVSRNIVATVEAVSAALPPACN